MVRPPLRPPLWPPARLGILADDFTGACDTGVAFAARGQAAVVTRSAAHLPGAAVVALDVGTRESEALQAQAVVAKAAARLAAAGVPLVFKKVDSTLRGPLGAELAAVAAGRPVLFCPAFPALGRTVTAGRVLVDGVPLEQTPFAAASAVVPYLAPWAPGPVRYLDLATVRSPSALAAALAAAGDAWAVLDAETDADLDAIVAAGLARPALPLFAGAGGLGAALARAWFGATAAPAPPRPPGAGRGVGGRPPPARPAPPAAPAPAGGAGVGVAVPPPPSPLVRATLAAGRSVVVSAPLAPAPPGAVSVQLRALAISAAQQSRVAWLFASGGETARGLCAGLGAGAVTLDGERSPGVVQGRLADGPHAGLPLVVKAGAFGAPDLLVRLVQGG